MQGPKVAPKAPLGNNARPVQDLHHRTIRTNIDFYRQVRSCVFYLCRTYLFYDLSYDICARNSGKYSRSGKGKLFLKYNKR